jgi:shikimate kinase
MHLVFLYGPPAAGKYTVGSELAALSGLALFHNHLVVDSVAAVFPFGSLAFRRLREQFWMDVFEAACAEDRSLIFTFQPEGSVAPDFADRVRQTMTKAGGTILFVHLTLSFEEQVQRVANADRGKFGKLRSVDLLQSLQADFEACERAMPPPDLTIDTGTTAPAESARQIHALMRDRGLAR